MYVIKCSVVIPAYNAEPYLREAVLSALLSKKISVELIIIDDGSNDETAYIAESFSITYENVRFVKTENSGVSSARNLGLSMVTTDFVCFLDADDRLKPDALAHLYNVLRENHDAAAAYGSVDHIDEQSEKLNLAEDARDAKSFNPKITLESVLQANFIDTPGAILFRTSAIRSVGGFDPKLLVSEDWELYIRVIQIGYIIHGGKKVLDYRIHPSSAMNKKTLTFIDFEPALAKTFRKPASFYGMPQKTFRLYEQRRRAGVIRLMIYKSRGFKQQFKNLAGILITVYNSGFDPALIKSALRSFLSAGVRLI
jgi:glycosyltransferase involved in cell wall biosynthesis